MSFRSRANPDQRRRRVLLDENRLDDAAIPTLPRRVKRRRYGDDALTDAQPRITDLVPTSWRRISVIVTLLVLVDVAVMALHWFQADWSAQIADLPLRAIDGLQAGGLTQFWLTLQCGLAAGLCLLVYAIRRRRLDDLRGTYQVWIWASVVAGLLAVVCGSGVRDLVIFGLQRIPGIPQLTISAAYFWGLVALLSLPMLVRLLIEMRRVRSAQVLCIIAAVAGAVSEALQFTAIPSRIAATASLALLLAAVSLLMASLLSYARHVKLDAQGAFASRKKKKRRIAAEPAESDETEEGESAVSTRVDPPTTSVPRPNSLGAAINAARANDLDEQRRGGPLSKANRQGRR
jgi:hypothetical protein